MYDFIYILMKNKYKVKRKVAECYRKERKKSKCKNFIEMIPILPIVHFIHYKTSMEEGEYQRLSIAISENRAA